MYYASSMTLLAPDACVIDLTPPTFAGVSLLTPQPMGSIKVDYSAAVDTSVPVTYETYVSPGTVSAATLFAMSPALLSRNLSVYAFLDSNGDFIEKDVTYTVGVRCRDALNNLNTNTAILTTVAIGSANLAQVLQDLQTDLQQSLDDAQTVLSSLSSAGGTALTAELEIETVLDVEEIESV